MFTLCAGLIKYLKIAMSADTIITSNILRYVFQQLIKLGLKKKKNLWYTQITQINNLKFNINLYIHFFFCINRFCYI